MKRALPWARRAVQTLSLLFFVYLIVQTAFPLEVQIPVDLYLRMDPFIGVISLLTGRELISRMLPALGVLAVVALLGNFFCGWFCPMGATLDFFHRILFKERKRAEGPDDRALRKLRYGIFLFALAAGAVSLQVMYLTDPISLLTRSVVIAFFPPAIYVYNEGLALLQRVFPLLRMNLSQAVVPLFKVNLLIFAFFVAVVALNRVRQRFWCRYLCPLGTLLSLSSRFRLLRRTVTNDCTRCQKCVRACPVAVIPPEAPHAYRQQDCIACFNCVECPPRAVSFRFLPSLAGTDVAHEKKVSLTRRYVTGSLALGFVSALVVKANPLQSESGRRNDRLIRPPGALPEEEFVSVCTGCGQCLKVCPNNALQSTFLEAGLSGLYTPRLVPRIGYCEELCNFCGRVCPTAAIRTVPVEEKRLLQMGVAHIDKTRCIAWDTDKTCLVCNEQCSYHAIPVDDKKRPYVLEEKCTGCGICENKCPVPGEAAIIVHSTGVQKKIDPNSAGEGSGQG